jgi:hypothetical protein
VKGKTNSFDKSDFPDGFDLFKKEQEVNYLYK